MTKELSDVLGAAEAATERGLPAFDHVVMAKGVTRRAKRRRGMRQAGTGLLAATSIGALGLVGFLAYDHFQDVTPVVTPSVTDAPNPSPTGNVDWPEVADREVTTGVGLPDAVALTGEAYATADTGWVLAIFDSTKRSNVSDPVEGERVLYLVSPAGERFEVANLTRYGAPYLAAWDTERQVALIVEGRYVALTLDLASGEVTHEWQFCGEGGYMKAEDRPGEEWLLRGFCSGEPLDGIYTDDFTFVTDDGIVTGGEGITVMDVGDVQVRYEFEMTPAQSFRAYHPDGTEVAMQPVGEYIACYPMGPSLSGGLAVQCWAEGDSVTYWNLDLDGGPATPITTSATIGAIEAASGGSLPAEGAVVTGYCLAGDQEALITSHPAVVVLDEGSPVVVTNGEYRATWCFGGVGGTVLVTGVGPLWTWDAASGITVTLLPVPEPGDDGVWVGAAEGGAIIHP
ncbi:MAG: hypothetical protein JW722_06635 [Demequinaceae bacterium]|nr:hypothetical protein [Demequinaceae bacterium]